MKFKDQVRYRLVDRTVDGVTHTVRQRYTETVPVLPRDWDQLAVRGAAALILGLTAVAITWSTVSIGSLLGGGVGYAAAALFDLAWLVVLVLEWLARFHPGKRRFPRVLGWLLALVAAGAIAWHGALAGSVAMAVVGAAVSIVAKTLWLGLFRHVDKELSPEDQEWVAAELSRANATLALASVRRQVAKAEVVAAAELLAAERVRAAFPIGKVATSPVVDSRQAVTSTGDNDYQPEPAPVVEPTGTIVPTAEPATGPTTEATANPAVGPAALPRVIPVPVEVPIVPELEAVPLPPPVAQTTTETTTSHAANKHRQMVTSLVVPTTTPATTETSPGQLRQAARRLNKQHIREHGRPVTVQAIKDGLGISRRKAEELRREVVDTGRRNGPDPTTN